MKTFILLFAAWINISLVFGQSEQMPAHYARERAYDVLHYKLNLEIDEKAKTCVGDVSIKLIPLRTMFDVVTLDAAEMKVTQVKSGRQMLEFHTEGETLFVGLDKPYDLQDTIDLLISYSLSNPRKGMYFVQPDSGSPDKLRSTGQVWTQGEPEDNHFWFPCYDYPNDKATSEMIVTVNEPMTVIGNGKLLGMKKDTRRKQVTYHWYEGKPHSSYLVSFVAGEYVELKDASGTVPISNYVYPLQADRAMLSFSKTPKMIEYFSTKIGHPYPWEKFSQTVVQDFVFGGMENVSAVTLTDGTIHDEKAHIDYSSDGLVAHELAHQWWGDLLTFRDWSHAWLSEGFASYFGILFSENDKGRDEAMKMILDTQGTLVMMDISENRRPTVCNRFINPIDIFDNRIYGKGACVLHMLRFVLGEELFWKSINHYVNKHAYQLVETNDFKIAIEEATGYNLHWFFDQWVYKAGYPEFDVTAIWKRENRTLQVIVKQIQKIDSLTGIFVTPVEIELWVQGQQEIHRVVITKAWEEFAFPAAQQPQLVIFDKGSQILKKVHYRRSEDELIFQLENAKEGVDRLLAIEELSSHLESDKVVTALTKAMLEDYFWAVRREAALALGQAKADVSEKLISAYGDRDSRVRAASVQSLAYCKGEPVLKAIRYAFESDPSDVVVAASLRSLVRFDSSNRRAYCQEGLKRDSYNEGIRSTALQLIGKDSDDDALQTVRSYTMYGVDRNLRIEALRILASNWKTREDVVKHLIGFLSNPSFHIRRAVIGYLGDMETPLAIEPLQAAIRNEADARLVKQARESLEKIQKANRQK